MTQPFLSGGGPAITTRRPIEAYELTLGETAGAAARSAFDNSLISDIWREGRNALDVIGGFDPRHRGIGRRYDAETARRKAKDAGVQIDVPVEGMGVSEFDTLLELRKRQKRDAIELSMRPRTAAGWAAETAGSLAGFSVDPINVAAAFIPVVGQARYAGALARAGSMAGRAGVRLRYGAIEGAVGAAAVEPLNLALNAKYEPEYGLADSFLNVVFGGVLGGGLHVMGGAVADRFTTRSRVEAGRAPETQARAALGEAVTAADNGRAVDVAGVFRRADPEPAPAPRQPDVTPAALERAQTDLEAVRAGAGSPKLFDLTPRTSDRVQIGDTLVQYSVAADGAVTLDLIQTPKEARGSGSARAAIKQFLQEIDEAGRPARLTADPMDKATSKAKLKAWYKSLGFVENKGKNKDFSTMAGMLRSASEPASIDDIVTTIRDEAKAAGIVDSDPPEVAAFKLARHRAERAYAEAVGPDMADPVVQPDVYDPSSGYEPDDMATLRGQADEAVVLDDEGSALDGEVEALGEYLNMARARERLTAADEAVLALADEFDAKAKLSGNAYKAAAACMSGLA